MSRKRQDPLAPLDGPEVMAAVLLGLIPVVERAADNDALPRPQRAWVIALADALAPVRDIALRVPRADMPAADAPAVQHEVH